MDSYQSGLHAIVQAVDDITDALVHGRFYEIMKSPEYPTIADLAKRLEDCVAELNKLCDERPLENEAPL